MNIGSEAQERVIMCAPDGIAGMLRPLVHLIFRTNFLMGHRFTTSLARSLTLIILSIPYITEL